MIIQINQLSDLISIVYWRLLAFTGRFLKAFPDHSSRVSQHLSVFYPLKGAENGVYWASYYYVIDGKPVNGFPIIPVKRGGAKN